MPILTQEQAARFDSKTEFELDSDCILWTGATKTSGYGCLSIERKLHYAHRIAYERAYGAIHVSMTLDHTCHNRRCVNPSHLQVATAKENAENLSGTRAVSGYRGVIFIASRNKYRVKVKHNGQAFYGGYFTSPEKANEAAIALRNELFTNNLLDRASSAS